MNLRLLFPTLLILAAFVYSGYAQEDDRAAAIQAIKAAHYSNAIDLLKKLTKAEEKNAEAWQLLGSAYFGRKKYGDAIKSYQRATGLDPKNERYLTDLAYIYLIVNDRRAESTANSAIELNPKNAQAHLIAGVALYHKNEFASALERADQAIRIDPGFAAPHRLRSQALIAIRSTPAAGKESAAYRDNLLAEAAASLEKHIGLLTSQEDAADLEDELKTLRYFAQYYSRPDVRALRDSDGPEQPDPIKTPLKILKKESPDYTEDARRRSVEGTLQLLVAFNEDGNIGPVMVVKSLDAGLDREAIKFARKIKFAPPTKNGVPYTVVKTVEYSFRVH